MNHASARPARGNEKGRVERAIHYVRNSFFAARSFNSIADLNVQALSWINQIAHQRRWQQDDNRNVEQALQEEQPRLLPLAAHRFESDLILPVRSGKTCYIRFDGNDYSIPPEFVGRALMLVVSPEKVRLLQDSTEIAHHRRSYDRHQLISNPAHIDAVLAQKKKALGGSAKTRLSHAVPKVQSFFRPLF